MVQMGILQGVYSVLCFFIWVLQSICSVRSHCTNSISRIVVFAGTNFHVKIRVLPLQWVNPSIELWKSQDTSTTIISLPLPIVKFWKRSEKYWSRIRQFLILLLILPTTNFSRFLKENFAPRGLSDLISKHGFVWTLFLGSLRSKMEISARLRP